MKQHGGYLSIQVVDEDKMDVSPQSFDKATFLEHRKIQEASHFKRNTHGTGLIKTLLTVEINTTELCNRKCVFCPRFDETVFPNRNLNMSPAAAALIAERLSDAQYAGKISFSGFGENFLNPEFPEIVHIFCKKLPHATIECNTNGDKLTPALIDQVFGNGLDLLYINLYDGPDQMAEFEQMIAPEIQDRVKYRVHWDDKEHGLILNNRSGRITWTGQDDGEIEKLRGQPCHYPFYKMFVDWNGDVLFCSNDWGREQVVGNLIQDTLEDVWFSKAMAKIRKRLAKGDRSSSPCNQCNVKGVLFGAESFRILNEHYESGNNR